jgi:hypothetical protein
MTWDVPNPKGRGACILSAIVWSLFLAMIVLRGEWGATEILFALLFALLLLLSVVRGYQEWREGGEWLE